MGQGGKCQISKRMRVQKHALLAPCGYDGIRRIFRGSDYWRELSVGKKVGLSFDKPTSESAWYIFNFASTQSAGEWTDERDEVEHCSGYILFLDFLTDRQHPAFGLFHGDMPFQDRSIANNQALRVDITNDGTRRLNFESFLSLHVGHHLALY
jgi:hypothetical protein